MKRTRVVLRRFHDRASLGGHRHRRLGLALHRRQGLLNGLLTNLGVVALLVVRVPAGKVEFFTMLQTICNVKENHNYNATDNESSIYWDRNKKLTTYFPNQYSKAINRRIMGKTVNRQKSIILINQIR